MWMQSNQPPNISIWGRYAGLSLATVFESYANQHELIWPSFNGHTFEGIVELTKLLADHSSDIDIDIFKYKVLGYINYEISLKLLLPYLHRVCDNYNNLIIDTNPKMTLEAWFDWQCDNLNKMITDIEHDTEPDNKFTPNKILVANEINSIHGFLFPTVTSLDCLEQCQLLLETKRPGVLDPKRVYLDKELRFFSLVKELCSIIQTKSIKFAKWFEVDDHKNKIIEEKIVAFERKINSRLNHLNDKIFVAERHEVITSIKLLLGVEVDEKTSYHDNWNKLRELVTADIDKEDEKGFRTGLYRIYCFFTKETRGNCDNIHKFLCPWLYDENNTYDNIADDLESIYLRLKVLSCKLDSNEIYYLDGMIDSLKKIVSPNDELYDSFEQNFNCAEDDCMALNR